MPFISNTDEQREAMLKKIGVSSFKELLQDIPENLFVKKSIELDPPLSEMEIKDKISELANKNTNTNQITSFLGGGIYDHFIPAAVNYLTGRPEFYSAYTPYQAEVSQGTLQFIYEYQTMICELTGMDAANAGMYDGATAAAEALLMAFHKNRKQNKILIATSIHPHYKEVIKTYFAASNAEIIYIPQKNGRLNIDALKEKTDKNTAAVLVQTPNFFGTIEDMKSIDTIVHSERKALLIAAVDPISLMLLKPPSAYNVDIVIGEGQALGNSQNFGGPLFGFFASNRKLIRKMPGRIIGSTTDKDGNKGYVMTLQTREQHIRREKATSNICTSESLCTLAATVYMVLMGKKGLKEVAKQSTLKAHYLHNKLCRINGIEPANSSPFFKEFAIKTEVEPELLIDRMQEKGFLAGIDLKTYGYENYLLLAVTEKRSQKEMDEFVKILEEEIKKSYL